MMMVKAMMARAKFPNNTLVSTMRALVIGSTSKMLNR
jgi:hypothetical protein